MLPIMNGYGQTSLNPSPASGSAPMSAAVPTAASISGTSPVPYGGGSGGAPSGSAYSPLQGIAQLLQAKTKGAPGSKDGGNTIIGALMQKAFGHPLGTNTQSPDPSPQNSLGTYEGNVPSPANPYSGQSSGVPTDAGNSWGQGAPIPYMNAPPNGQDPNNPYGTDPSQLTNPYTSWGANAYQMDPYQNMSIQPETFSGGSDASQ